MAENEDILAVLQRQHAQVAALLDEVVPESGDVRSEKFALLEQLLTAHETGEQEVVHPVTRAESPEAEAVVARRVAEEAEASAVLAGLKEIGPADPGFEPEFLSFKASVLAHAASEQNEEFHLLEAQPLEERERMGARLVEIVGV